MACKLCEEMEGDWTSHEEAFNATFNVIDCANTSMTSVGTAACKTCGQKVDFVFDDTLIPKLRVSFVRN